MPPPVRSAQIIRSFQFTGVLEKYFGGCPAGAQIFGAAGKLVLGCIRRFRAGKGSESGSDSVPPAEIHYTGKNGCLNRVSWLLAGCSRSYNSVIRCFRPYYISSFCADLRTFARTPAGMSAGLEVIIIIKPNYRNRVVGRE